MINTTILSTIPGSQVVSPETYNGLRTFLRQRLIHDNPFVRRDIQRYRANVIAQHINNNHNNNNNNGGDINTTTTYDTTNWKIVGLTQRSTRRRWTNLNNVLKATGKKFRQEQHHHHDWNNSNNNNNNNIILMKVNVEEEGWNPYTQLIRHAALDGLIGIHGAQLTEGIWMPPGSLVVELLPYIPDDKGYGQWTRTTNLPTPLGRIYTDSDLNHVGIPLDVESAPYCYFVNNRTGCWRGLLPIEYANGETDDWDERDFQVGADVIEHVIRSMIMVNNTVTTTTTTTTEASWLSCDEYLKHANKDFVLYNVNCRETKEEQVTAKHFYWNKEE